MAGPYEGGARAEDPAAAAVQAWRDLPAGKKLLKGSSAGWFGLGALLRFEELLGRGSQGQAWLCRDRRTGAKMVAKVMRRAPTPQAGGGGREPRGGRHTPKMKFSAKRLAGEILMQSSVHHPNVVALHGVVLSPTHLAILLEPCLGGELNEYIKLAGTPWKVPPGGATRLPQALLHGGRLASTVVADPPHMPVLGEASACYFFLEILTGLESCHANHIAHRDLKFSNIVLGAGSPPQVKIADFGLAQHFFVAKKSPSVKRRESSGSENPADPVPEVPERSDEDENLEEVFARCRTRVGTPNYVPREIAKRSLCRSGYNGCAADVWSLGVMLFCMLTGKFPFPDLDGHLTLLKRLDSDLHNDMLAFMMSEAGLSVPAKELLTWMLHMDADARPTLAEIREHKWIQGEQKALKADAAALAPGTRAIARGVLPVRRRRRRSLGSRTEEAFAKVREDLFGPFLRALRKLDAKNSLGDPPPAHSSGHTPMDEDEARFRTSQGFPEASWLELRGLISCAEEGPGHPKEQLRLWRPKEGSYRLSRHREDGSVHDYRSDVHLSALNISGENTTASSNKTAASS